MLSTNTLIKINGLARSWGWACLQSVLIAMVLATGPNCEMFGWKRSVVLKRFSYITEKRMNRNEDDCCYSVLIWLLPYLKYLPSFIKKDEVLDEISFDFFSQRSEVLWLEWMWRIKENHCKWRYDWSEISRSLDAVKKRFLKVSFFHLLKERPASLVEVLIAC